MTDRVFIALDTDTEIARKLLPVLERYWLRRFDEAVTDKVDEVQAVVHLEDRLPVGHGPGSEGYAIATRVEGGVTHYHITGETLGLVYGAGRLLREVLRDGAGGIAWPQLTVDEQPTLALRGIYFPTHRSEGNPPRPFNAYAAWLYHEERFDDFEDVLVELMFWGMNAIGIWYCEAMPAPGDGPDGRRLERMYRKIVEIARSWRLRVCLLMTTTLLPLADDHPLAGHRSVQIPDGLWAKFEVQGSYCPNVPEVRRMIRAYRDKLITIFQPDSIEIFPTDPGGCDCPQCTPWWQHYLALAREILAPWVDRVPLRSINFWYFWNRDATALAEQLQHDNIINTVSTQSAWQESTRDRLRIADRLTAQGIRTIFWPDITMNGGWGTYGTYPFPNELKSLFRTAKRTPYGILPYTEGRYDDFNKFAMLALAWNPSLDAAEVTRQVMTGMFGQQMPDAALHAVTALEDHMYPLADDLLKVAESQLDATTTSDWRWFSLRFHARHAPLGELEGKLLQALTDAKTAAVGQPLPARRLKPLRQKFAEVESRFNAYRAELPELYRLVNDFRRHHNLNCGTTLPAAPLLRKLHHLDEMRALLRELAGQEKIQLEALAATSARDFRESGQGAE